MSLLTLLTHDHHPCHLYTQVKKYTFSIFLKKSLFNIIEKNQKIKNTGDQLASFKTFEKLIECF
jgi:hypothetical protein